MKPAKAMGTASLCRSEGSTVQNATEGYIRYDTSRLARVGHDVAGWPPGISTSLASDTSAKTDNLLSRKTVQVLLALGKM